MTLTITDLFCGAGGSSSGAIQVPGVTVRMAANHWRLAVDTHNTNHPDADHDCFPAGTPVLTSLGLRPIEAIEPGELVLTHRGRWRPVVRKFEKVDDTVIVRTALHAPGVEVTANHEFWTRRTTLHAVRPDYRRTYSKPAWQPIGDARIDRVRRTGRSRDMVALPHTFSELAWQDPPEALGTDPVAAWWLIGRWLGDGSSSTRNHDVTITCGKHEADSLAPLIPAHWRSRPTGTAHAFYDYDLKLSVWLTSNFGHGAADKGLPGWTLTMPTDRREALLAGYLSADGSSRHGVTRASTVSRDLALSVRFLAHSLGKVASLHLSDRSGACEIQGRTVQRLAAWSVQWCDRPARAATYDDDTHRWVYVQSVKPGRSQVEVYTMEVEEDHSYVADGLVVKNCADISQTDPRRYPQTDILWASPECTNHSQAKGRKKADQQPDLLGLTLPDEAAERSRATMWDVIRFAEHHRYAGIVVENVVDVRDWELWPAWVAALAALGYEHQVVYLNSMFAQAAGYGAPQSRDRLYVVAWRAGNRRPDLPRWTRPRAWCPACEDTVTAVQAWKRPDRQRGRYRQQYVWRCPNVTCRNTEVYPGVLPAAAAIDWALAGERIGDRGRPLAPKTLARIRAGLAKYGRAIHLEAAGNTFERRPGVRAWPVDEPLRTVHTSPSKALACPPMLVPAGGTWNDGAAPVTDPFRTRTTRDTEALAVPAPFIALLRTNATTHRVDEPLNTISAGGGHHALVVPVEGRDGINARSAAEPARTQTARLQDALVVPLRNNGVARPAEQAPLMTVAAAGNHHGMVVPPGFVMRNNTARGNPAQMCTPLDEPVRTVTTAGHQSLVTWPWMVYDYNGPARHISEPLPTQTTVEGDGLTSIEVDVDDCLFRMLAPHEIQAAMAFTPEYIVLGNQRERVRQLGNAVTPPAARDLIAALVEAITGEPLALAGVA